jgi:hypothetical protein
MSSTAHHENALCLDEAQNKLAYLFPLYESCHVCLFGGVELRKVHD